MKAGFREADRNMHERKGLGLRGYVQLRHGRLRGAPGLPTDREVTRARDEHKSLRCPLGLLINRKYLEFM